MQIFRGVYIYITTRCFIRCSFDSFEVPFFFWTLKHLSVRALMARCLEDINKWRRKRNIRRWEGVRISNIYTINTSLFEYIYIFILINTHIFFLCIYSFLFQLVYCSTWSIERLDHIPFADQRSAFLFFLVFSKVNRKTSDHRGPSQDL